MKCYEVCWCCKLVIIRRSMVNKLPHRLTCLLLFDILPNIIRICNFFWITCFQGLLNLISSVTVKEGPWWEHQFFPQSVVQGSPPKWYHQLQKQNIWICRFPSVEISAVCIPLFFCLHTCYFLYLLYVPYLKYMFNCINKVISVCICEF